MMLPARYARLVVLAGVVASLGGVGLLLRSKGSVDGTVNPPPTEPVQLAPRDSVGLTPLTDLGALVRYKGEDGGLYGGGGNEPTGALLRAALEASGRVRPLDARGRPDANGKVVLVAVGMSNTTQEFRRFMAIARRDPEKSPAVILVDGAQGGMISSAWADPALPISFGRPDPWTILNEHLVEEGGTAPQVQAAWVKVALAHPGRLGDFPVPSYALRTDLEVIIRRLEARFPNLQLVYLTSRTYGGYASTALNPEPHAYESAFAVRGLILDRARVGASGPVVLWGPYLWADGLTPRSDGLVWAREDYAPDGSHPSPIGRQKVADLLLAFFRNDPSARGWFRSRSSISMP